MSSAALPAATAAAFEHLIDYAGLFPPAQLDLDDALRGHAEAASGRHAWMLGRFIIPLARLIECDRPIPLSVIVPADEAAFEALDRARETGLYRIESLEIPPADPPVIRELCERHGWRNVPIYAEIALQGEFESTVHYLAPLELRAKFRCGGTVPEAFPSVETLARGLEAAANAGIPYKATAGLHHPVRHYNKDAGAWMHGFLNLLLAAASGGEGVSRVAAVLAQEDPRVLELPDAQALAAARARFVSYGSCSFEEPIDDLRSLGLIS